MLNYRFRFHNTLIYTDDEGEAHVRSENNKRSLFAGAFEDVRELLAEHRLSGQWGDPDCDDCVARDGGENE